MAGSTVSVVRQHLTTLFGQHPSVGAAAVWFADPGDDKRGREYIVCTGVSTFNMSIPLLRAGRRRREEVYALRWHCGVKGLGLDQVEADTRAVELLTVVLETVADNPGLAGVPIDAASQQIIGCQVTGAEAAEGPVDKAWWPEYVASVAVKARLL